MDFVLDKSNALSLTLSFSVDTKATMILLKNKNKNKTGGRRKEGVARVGIMWPSFVEDDKRLLSYIIRIS